MPLTCMFVQAAILPGCLRFGLWYVFFHGCASIGLYFVYMGLAGAHGKVTLRMCGRFELEPLERAAFVRLCGAGYVKTRVVLMLPCSCCWRHRYYWFAIAAAVCVVSGVTCCVHQGWTVCELWLVPTSNN